MTDERVDFGPIEDEPTLDDGGKRYLPEGNEQNILREYLFRLDQESLTEGLVFPEEEETTLRPAFGLGRGPAPGSEG